MARNQNKPSASAAKGNAPKPETQANANGTAQTGKDQTDTDLTQVNQGNTDGTGLPTGTATDLSNGGTNQDGTDQDAANPVKADAAAKEKATKTTKAATNQVFRVRAVGVERRCRGGLCFDAEGVDIDFATLKAAQVQAINNDPHLKIDTSDAVAKALENQA